MNFGTLKTTLAGTLHRTDLTAVLPAFIDQARVRIGADLRSQANYVTGTATLFSAGLTALPANYSSIVAVINSDGAPLLFIPPDEILFNHGEMVYTVQGTDLVIPDASSTDAFTIIYYAIPAALVVDADVAEGMAEFPQLWIYAALAEGAMYCHDFDLAAQANEAYKIHLEAANRQGNRARFGPSMPPTASEYNATGSMTRL